MFTYLFKYAIINKTKEIRYNERREDALLMIIEALTRGT